MKSNREVIIELVDLVFEKINEETSTNKLMFMPALNIVKMKLSKLDDKDAENLVDTVHKVSKIIENETGNLSPYHGIDN